MNDDRIGSISITFQASNAKTFPFPGDAIVHNDVWKDSAFNDGIAWGNCNTFSKDGEITGTDCKGDQIVTRVCVDGFADGVEGVINDQDIVDHGWAYFMAFPKQGVNPGCPDPGSKVKRERTLSRFVVAEEE